MPLAADLRRDALDIWRAGLAAVRSDALVRAAVQVRGNELVLPGETLDLARVGRIVVVGGGKAGAGMAAGLEAALTPRILDEKKVRGWLNVPTDCIPKDV